MDVGSYATHVTTIHMQELRLFFSSGEFLIDAPV